MAFFIFGAALGYAAITKNIFDNICHFFQPCKKLNAKRRSYSRIAVLELVPIHPRLFEWIGAFVFPDYCS